MTHYEILLTAFCEGILIPLYSKLFARNFQKVNTEKYKVMTVVIMWDTK